MAGRRRDVLDIREILRRVQLGQGDRAIARDLGLSRKTVAKYRTWAGPDAVVAGPLPSPAELATRLAAMGIPAPPPRTPFGAAPYEARIRQLRAQGVECRAILARLQEEVGYRGSYSGLWRFVRTLEPRTPTAVLRIETPPGEEAQVDFGAGGRLRDPRDGVEKRAWLFVMTLSWSRHQYVEFVFDQTVATWLRCHRHAFDWFGGVPHRLVIDNLKAAIVRAVWHDPVVQRAYRECAEHYGFLIAPCRPATPQHKGKVEQGGVHYCARNFLAGRTGLDLPTANALVRTWCRETAGRRIHGTTKEPPLERFTTTEQAALRPLPAAPYAVAVWKQAKLHPDCHVVFEHAFYSAPHRLIGQTLWLRAAETSVVLYHAHAPIATHPRARRPGERCTHPDHLPPAKVVALMATPAWCLRQARELGPATTLVIERLLGERPLDRLRTALAIVRLAEKYPARRVEAACTRALAFDELRYHALKRILAEGLDALPLPGAAPPPELPTQFVRPWTDFFAPERVAREA
jgi:transposase